MYADVDKDHEPDAVVAAKTTRVGKKFVAGASNSTHAASLFLIYGQIAKLKKPGFYVEASNKIANVLMIAGVPIINDEERVRDILKKDITWIGELDGYEGDGWYSRKIDGITKNKIMLGRPLI